MSLAVYHTAMKARIPMIVYNNSICFRSTFSTEVKPISKRKLFRQITPDYNIINKLDDLQLGYNSKRKVRIAVAKKFGNIKGKAPILRQKSVQQVLKSQRYESPYPFRKFGIKLHSASTYAEVPDVFYGNPTPTEVAVIGRSNVGKSTLLNSLLAYDDSYIQKAPVSDKPGYTRDLGFYGLGIHPIKDIPISSVSALDDQKSTSHDKSSDNHNKSHKKTISTNTVETDENKIKRLGSAIVLVDMPGYGFSYMKESELKRVHNLCSDYLRYRGPTLKRVILLLDARHGFKIGDKEYFKRLVDGDVEEVNTDTSDDGVNNSTTITPTIKPIKSNQDEKKKGKTEIYFEFNNSPKNKNINPFPNSNNNSSSPSKTKLKKLKKNINWKLQIVLTKCDLLDRTELARRIQTVQDSIAEMLPGYGNMLSVLALSGKFGNGVLDLKKELASLVTPPPQWEHSNSTAAAAALKLSPPSTSSEIESSSLSSSSTSSSSLSSTKVGNSKLSSSPSVNKTSSDIPKQPFKYIPPSSWTSTLPPILTTYKYTGSKSEDSTNHSPGRYNGRNKNRSDDDDNDDRTSNRKKQLLDSGSNFNNSIKSDRTSSTSNRSSSAGRDMNKRSNMKSNLSNSHSLNDDDDDDEDYDDYDSDDGDDDDNYEQQRKASSSSSCSKYSKSKSKPRWRNIGKTHSSSSSSSGYHNNEINNDTKQYKSTSSSSSKPTKSSSSSSSSRVRTGGGDNMKSSSGNTTSSSASATKTRPRRRDSSSNNIEKNHRTTTAKPKERVSSTKRRTQRRVVTTYNEDDD